jgi:hypothetical protein
VCLVSRVPLLPSSARVARRRAGAAGVGGSALACACVGRRLVRVSLPR